MVPHTFVASRVELKGWSSWRNIRGTGITVEEAKQLVCMRPKQEDLNVFDWELTDSDQGIFDTKMMVFLWFKEGGHSHDAQERAECNPLSFKGVNIRATLELDPIKRPWNKAQAIFIGVMKEHANVSRGVSVVAPPERPALPIALASFSTGLNWAQIFENFGSLHRRWTRGCSDSCWMRDVEGRAPPPRRLLLCGSFAPLV